MLWFFAFIPILALVDAFLPSDFTDWSAFKANYSKHYASFEDEMQRFQIFVEHKYKIAEHNLHHDNGVESFRMGLNKYSDLTSEEFFDTMNGYIADDSESDYDNFNGPNDYELPESVDWRDKGAVSDVKDQGGCGACYAFAALDALESHHFIKTGDMLSLSEQHIIDCAHSNHGCHGGAPENVIRYIQQHGVCTDESYPFAGFQHNFCKLSAEKSDVSVHGFKVIPRGNEEELQKALAIHGPIIVAIDDRHDSFHVYKGDMWHEPNCGSDESDLHHAVVLVGYGTDEHERDYYILKNSWGTGWGDDGYFKMPRNQNNHCGIATRAILPIL